MEHRRILTSLLVVLIVSGCVRSLVNPKLDMAYFRMNRVMKDERDYRSVAENFLNNLRLQKTEQMAAMCSAITLKSFGGRKGVSEYYQKHVLPAVSDSVISLKPAGRGVIFEDDDYNVGIEFTGIVIPRAGEGKKNQIYNLCV
ncbi:MAG: hypothetical protein ABL974_01155 [Prosthecobacter sp.]